MLCRFPCVTTRLLGLLCRRNLSCDARKTHLESPEAPSAFRCEVAHYLGLLWLLNLCWLGLFLWNLPSWLDCWYRLKDRDNLLDVRFLLFSVGSNIAFHRFERFVSWKTHNGRSTRTCVVHMGQNTCSEPMRRDSLIRSDSTNPLGFKDVSSDGILRYSLTYRWLNEQCFVIDILRCRSVTKI